MKRALFALAALLVASPAAAGIEDTFALGPNAMALGGSYAARPGDWAAAYYNPAGLVGTNEHGGFFETSLSLVYAHPTLRVTGASGQNLFTPSVDDTAGAVVGSRFSVGQPFHVDGLDMGFSIYAPKHLFEYSIRPDDDVQWALLTDRTQVISAHVGLAYRVNRWLALGAGLRLFFDVQTITTGIVTDLRLDKDPKTGKQVVHTSTQIGTDAEVFGRVAPLAGAVITPSDAFRIGLVYRQKSYVDDWGSTRITGVPDLGDMGYTHRFAHYFEPTEMTAAASWDVSPRVDVSADVTFNRWSEAVSTNRNFFGEGRWGDTWTPAFGARWKATRAFSLMGGYRFQKSPLDNAGGPSNLLDGDRHVLSTGFALDLTSDVRIAFALMNVALVERTETKDFRRFPSDAALAQNPGNPSYTFGGHMLAGSLGVEARW